MEKPFIIYRSSAGSGKTYTLALEYLKLALRHPNAYRSILAVTFTNKATREMKSRILHFLYQMAQGKNPELTKQLGPALELEDEALRACAQDTLSQLLHGYSWFSVMTIDSFFQKVIRAFARELGLQAGFVLELDQERVLDEVVDQLLSEISDDRHRQLRQWMIRFAEEKVESGKVWDFRRDIKQLARELFKEDYKIRQETNHTGEAEAASGDKYPRMLKALKAIVAKFENAMQSFGEQGLSHMQQHGLEYTDFAYGKSGVGNYFVRMVDGSDYEPKKRVTEAAANPEKWSTQKSPKKDIIREAVESGLQEILQQAIAYYQNEHINYNSARQLLKFIYAYGILQDIQQKLDSYKRDNDVMLISDAALFLRQIIGRDDTPFVYEKIGSSFQHFLIDEFQDTSGLQWANFRPLVENSLDSGLRNLVVGDVKQSIYRWRGGDWQLLLEKIEQDIPSWNTQVLQLDHNYRSRANVIEFNNRLFARLPHAVYEEIEEKLAEVEDLTVQQHLRQRADIIRRAYEEAQQKLPKPRDTNDNQGYVEINLLSRQERDENGEVTGWKEQVKARIPVLVEELQDRGYRLRDIAFLVRDKKAGKEIVDTLMQYKYKGKAREGYRYELISSESLFLYASLSVGLLVDVLRFLNNPEDHLAKASVAYKYRKLQSAQASTDELHHIFHSSAQSGENDHDDFFQLLPSAFEDLFPYLNKLPLYELVENLISVFQLNQGEELAYLQAFQDAVLLYSGQETGDLHTFLKWWEEKGKDTSVQVAEEVDAMRILTIHKAKGLQFKVVLIPFCDWELDHRPGLDNIIWTEASQEPFASFGLMPMRYSRQLASTVFSQDYYEEMIRAYIDNINLLYVAFTRAEECLYAFSAPKVGKRGDCKLNCIANGLYQLCADDEQPLQVEGHWDEEQGKFSLGTPPVQQPNEDIAQDSTFVQPYPTERWRNRISVRPLAKSFFAMDKQGSMQINPAVVRRDVLARLRNADHLPQQLEKVYYERGLSREDVQSVHQVLAEALRQAPLSSWFDPEAQVEIRPRLISREGRQYSPDRIVREAKQVILLQFHEDANDQDSRHALEGAAGVLKEMGYPVEVYLWDTQAMRAMPLQLL